VTWAKCGHVGLIDGFNRCHHWSFVESRMYLQNSASQVLYMDVASQSHPGSLNLAASLNSMSFNIGIAVGSAVGGLVNAHLGLMWLGPVGAIFLLCAVGVTTLLRPFIARERDFYAKQQA
jgi:DHA1 family inner membrane transport protein